VDPLVSLIIVNYNGKVHLKRCIESVLKTDYNNLEILFVDNGSTDSSVVYMQEQFGKDARLRIIRNECNLGFAGGNNVGIKNSKGKYVIFLNNDTEATNSWVKELVSVAESDPSVGACQSKLLVLGSTDVLDGAGDFVTVHGLAFPRGYLDKDRYSKVEEVFSGKGAALLVRRDILNEAGFFDEAYFNGYEDVDLCWRIRLRGYKVMFVPRSVVFHVGRASTGKSGSKELFHKHKNFLTTFLKNYNSKNMIKYLPPTVLLRLIISLSPSKDIREIYKPSTNTALKSFMWVLLHFRSIWKKRLMVQYHIRKTTDSEILNMMPHSDFEVQILKWFLFNRSSLWEYLHRLTTEYYNLKSMNRV